MVGGHILCGLCGAGDEKIRKLLELERWQGKDSRK